MQALEFPRGNYYIIICKAGDQALRVQQSDPSKFQKSRIVSTQPNSQDNNQIFMIQKVGLAEDSYEIVSCPTTLVFDQQGKQIRIKYGKQNKDQLFALVQAPVQGFHKYYWIKTDLKGNQALSLQGILKYGKFDPNSDTQIFRFEQANNNSAIQNSVILINNNSEKVLDAPGATWNKGERLVIWQKNRRWNQRWRFIKQPNGVMIQSLFNGQVVDIAEQKKNNGSKVIQWQVTGRSNQQWRIEPAGNNLYKIRSSHQPSLFLSIKNQDIDDGGKIQVSNVENPSMYWRIQGNFQYT